MPRSLVKSRTARGSPWSTDAPSTTSPAAWCRFQVASSNGISTRHGRHHVAHTFTSTTRPRSDCDVIAESASVCTTNVGKLRSRAVTFASAPTCGSRRGRAQTPRASMSHVDQWNRASSCLSRGGKEKRNAMEFNLAQWFVGERILELITQRSGQRRARREQQQSWNCTCARTRLCVPLGALLRCAINSPHRQPPHVTPL